MSFMDENPAVTVPVIALLLSTACGGAPSGQLGNWVADRDTIGDTVIVRTVSGSVWTVPMGLKIDLSIGVLDGDSTLMIGGVLELAVDAAGGIYAFDYMVPALRYFNAQGDYVRTIGRDGAGPGEYRAVVHGVAVRSDGRVVMGDFNNRRLNVFHPDGTPSDHWPIDIGSFMNSSLVLDHRDHIFLKVAMRRELGSPIGFQHYDASGNLVDTLPPPVISGEPTDPVGMFVPRKVWSLSPLAVVIVGVSDRYAIELRNLLKGTVTRIERLVTPEPVLPEERAELEARREWTARQPARRGTPEGALVIRGVPGSARGPPPIPASKPFYHALYGGERGRIWVHRHVKAHKVDIGTERDPSRPPPRTWQEPTVFDVFESDGVYLGEVQVPPNIRLKVFRGDTVWGIQQGEFDEPYIIRAVIDSNTT